MPARIRINWFSPLPPANTGIALCTEGIVEAIADLADITLWTDQAEWDPKLDRMAPVRHFDSARPAWHELNRGDVNFYNIGNNRQFHKGIWEISRRNAGIVILHDICLQHFFADMFLNELGSPDEYSRTMEQYYGRRGREAVRLLLKKEWTIEQLSIAFPLTPLALENSLGVIIHNRAGVREVLKMQSLPIAYLPLPYAATISDCHGAHQPRKGAGPPYQLIAFGFMGPNRRLEPFLEAWAGLPQKAAFRLRICGRLWDDNRIASRIRELGLEDLAQVCGYLSNEALEAELSRADMAINLRYPTMGEASLSQLIIWDHALPSLVTRVGWYATLPPETVAFIRPEHEIADIQLQLCAFQHDPEYFFSMGRCGREVLRRDHTPENYAESLVGLAAVMPDWCLRAANLGMAARAGQDMRRWITPDASQTLTGRVTRVIWEIGGHSDPVM